MQYIEARCMCDIKFNNSFSATSTLRRISYYLIIWTLPFNGKPFQSHFIAKPTVWQSSRFLFIEPFSWINIWSVTNFRLNKQILDTIEKSYQKSNPALFIVIRTSWKPSHAHTMKDLDCFNSFVSDSENSSLIYLW